MVPEPTNGGLHDGGKSKVICVFTSHAEADIAAATLQAHGIHCWVSADDAGGMLPNLASPGGVRLWVGESDASAALALLEGRIPPAEITVQNQTGEAAPSPARRATGKRLAPGQIFVGIVAGVLLCLFYQWCGKLGTRTVYSYTKDGKIDKKWVYRDGHLIECLRDRNHDGAWDQWVYYEHGQVVRSEVDNNFDGKPDETWTHSNGVLVKMEKDTDFNGTPDEFCTYKNEVIQQIDIRPNGAKFATQRQLYRNGVLVEILREGDGAGNFKESVQYDPFFNAIGTNKLEK